MHAQSCLVGRAAPFGESVRPKITLSAHKSTSLARTHAQKLSVHTQLRACMRRKLLRMQARRCELECVADCVSRTLKVAYARSVFERAPERERSIYARSILSGWPRGPDQEVGSNQNHFERA